MRRDDTSTRWRFVLVPSANSPTLLWVARPPSCLNTQAYIVRRDRKYDMTQWCSLDEAVGVVGSGNRIFVQGACATPTPLLEALVARGNELRNVEITHLHTYGPTPYTDKQWEGHFSLRALFVGENV